MRKEGAAKGEMKGYGKGRVRERVQREIKQRVRYPSVPGLEFDQLKGSGVRGSVNPWPGGPVVSAEADKC